MPRLSIRVSLESDSNVNDEREKQPQKHSLQRISANDGIQMDLNALQLWNALTPIRLIIGSDLKINEERDEDFALFDIQLPRWEMLSMHRGRMKKSTEPTSQIPTYSVEIATKRPRKQMTLRGNFCQKVTIRFQWILMNSVCKKWNRVQISSRSHHEG
jgi:hypothetical protein